MKERPILFNSEMVRAILEGRKTQTRRMVNPQPPKDHKWHGWVIESSCRKDEGKATWSKCSGPLLKNAHRVRCPFGQVGDRLWVRETTKIDRTNDSVYLGTYIADGEKVLYQNHHDPEYNGSCAHWWYSRDICPSIHMPRWASRITLEITSVRIDRFQDISEKDAKAEGVNKYNCEPISGMYVDYAAKYPVPADNAKDSFRTLWQSINGPENWDANPWVWVIEFERID